jgi:hypothetical protein
MALWILTGVAAFIVLSCAVGIVVATVLGRIGSQVSELLELESWSLAPPTHRSHERVV